MNDFFENMTDGLSEINQKIELPEFNAADALREVRQTAELSQDDSSWLENLFRRIAEPVVDVIETTEDGCDTERISPAESTEAGESVKAHDIAEAAGEWHMQEGENACAVCSQQFIINEFLDLDLTEEQLCTLAEANGWFDPEEGTPLSDTGNLLEAFGIDTHVNYEGSIQEIKKTLDQGGRVIVAVDSMALWVDGYGNYPIYGADHAVQVIGIDDSNPQDVRVIINDSGIENGCGRSVPYLEFMESWMPSGGFMVSAFPAD